MAQIAVVLHGMEDSSFHPVNYPWFLFAASLFESLSIVWMYRQILRSSV